MPLLFLGKVSKVIVAINEKVKVEIEGTERVSCTGECIYLGDTIKIEQMPPSKTGEAKYLCATVKKVIQNLREPFFAKVGLSTYDKYRYGMKNIEFIFEAEIEYCEEISIREETTKIVDSFDLPFLGTLCLYTPDKYKEINIKEGEI